MNKRKLTREEMRMKRYDYSIKIGSLCFIMLAILVIASQFIIKQGVNL